MIVGEVAVRFSLGIDSPVSNRRKLSIDSWFPLSVIQLPVGSEEMIVSTMRGYLADGTGIVRGERNSLISFDAVVVWVEIEMMTLSQLQKG
jgi:hypothetical protein